MRETAERAAAGLEGFAPEWGRHALFLDFDGTLAPIVARPEDAALAPGLGPVLDRLEGATGGALALISGRALADLDRRLGGARLAASGSHGAEIRRPGAEIRAVPPPEALAGATAEMLAYAAVEGLLAEEKPAAVTLHYRGRPELEGPCRALAERLAEGSDRLRALHGHMVSEVALRGVDKGTALAAFMAEAPFAGRIPVAAGDDTTDEDAFRVAAELGGVGVKIGPGPTAAALRADDIRAFHRWLAGSVGLAAAVA